MGGNRRRNAVGPIRERGTARLALDGRGPLICCLRGLSESSACVKAAVDECRNATRVFGFPRGIFSPFDDTTTSIRFNQATYWPWLLIFRECRCLGPGRRNSPLSGPAASKPVKDGWIGSAVSNVGRATMQSTLTCSEEVVCTCLGIHEPVADAPIRLLL